MERSISDGQKRHLKRMLGEVVDGLGDDLDYEGTKRFIDEGGSGVRFVKEGVRSLLLTHIRPVSDAAAPSPARIWTPSKVIQVGTVKDERAMREVLKAAGREVGSWASDILPQVRYSPYTPQEPRDVKLVFVSNEDLGLTDEWIPLERTHTAGLQQGLELCEWEDGPQLAAQYRDQPYGEVLRLAMKPIVDSDGYSDLFAVAHDGRGRWLYARYGRPGREYRRTYRFVFRGK